MASTNNRATFSDYEPTPRYGHALVAYKSKTYLVGGYGSNGKAISLSSIDIFDPTILKWQHHRTTGDGPMAAFATAYAINKNFLYFFGGYLGYQHVNSFFKLDLESLKWSSISQSYTPKPRAWAKMIVLNEDNLLLYGGEDASGILLTSFHIFSISKGE